jgi:hypothetical protein
MRRRQTGRSWLHVRSTNAMKPSSTPARPSNSRWNCAFKNTAATYQMTTIASTIVETAKNRLPNKRDATPGRGGAALASDAAAAAVI